MSDEREGFEGPDGPLSGALAAVGADESTAVPASLIAAVAETAFDDAHEHCAEDGCTGGGLPFWQDMTAAVLAALTVHARIVPADADPVEAGALAGVTVESRREQLGRLVRETWVAWASERPDAKPSWLIPWQKLDSAEGQREVDMRIGEAVAAAERERIAAAAGRLTAALERPAENVVVWNRCDTCEALEDRAEAAEAALADAVAAERERIRQLAIRNQAVCTGDEGTSCFFADLIPSPGGPVEAASPHPAVVAGIPGVRDAETGRLRGELAAKDQQLARIREITEDWIAGHDYAEFQTVGTAIQAQDGRAVLAVIEGAGEAGQA